MIELAVLGVVALVVTGAAALARQSRGVTRDNQVVPGVVTTAPRSWAGAHSDEARLHRRLRDAVRAARAVRGLPEPERLTIEADAVAIDEALVAAHRLAPQHRAERLAPLTAAVERLEAAVAAAVDEMTGEGRAVSAVAERLRLVAEARAELDALERGEPG